MINEYNISYFEFFTCTECGICVEECPQHIDISEVMKDDAKTFETDYHGFID